MLLGRIAQLENKGLGELGMSFWTPQHNYCYHWKDPRYRHRRASYGPKTPFTAVQIGDRLYAPIRWRIDAVQHSSM